MSTILHHDIDFALWRWWDKYTCSDKTKISSQTDSQCNSVSVIWLVNLSQKTSASAFIITIWGRLSKVIKASPSITLGQLGHTLKAGRQVLGPVRTLSDLPQASSARLGKFHYFWLNNTESFSSAMFLAEL